MVAKAAEIQPRVLGSDGTMICHQSFALVLPTTGAVAPLVRVPRSEAVVPGPERIRRFSLAVAMAGAVVGVNVIVAVGAAVGCVERDPESD